MHQPDAADGQKPPPDRAAKNSGPGVQAAISGTRPIVDKTSLAAPVAVSIDNIEKTYDIDRDRWLVEICHTEYTLQEIKQGLWLKRLQEAL